MTANEFKHWFEGFSEGITGAPSEKQWKKIQERVKTIMPEPNLPLVIQRESPRPWWPQPYVTWTAPNTSGTPKFALDTITCTNKVGEAYEVSDIYAAATAIGRCEAGMSKEEELKYLNDKLKEVMVASREGEKCDDRDAEAIALLVGWFIVFVMFLTSPSPTTPTTVLKFLLLLGAGELSGYRCRAQTRRFLARVEALDAEAERGRW